MVVGLSGLGEMDPGMERLRAGVYLDHRWKDYCLRWGHVDGLEEWRSVDAFFFPYIKIQAHHNKTDPETH